MKSAQPSIVAKVWKQRKKKQRRELQLGNLVQVEKKDIRCYLTCFCNATDAISGALLVGIFAKSGRTLSIGVDKQVPRDFKYTKLRRGYRSAVSVRHPVTVQRIIHRTSVQKKRM